MLMSYYDPTKDHIILDIDETLISAAERTKCSAEILNRRFLFQHSFTEDNSFIICERPHLQPFLDHLFTTYNVSIWTAANKYYLQHIIKNVILRNNRRIFLMFWSDHVKVSQEIYQTNKQLSILWDILHLPFNTKNVVILDDNVEVFNSQPSLCVHITPFEFQATLSENDNELVVMCQIIAEKLNR